MKSFVKNQVDSTVLLVQMELISQDMLGFQMSLLWFSTGAARLMLLANNRTQQKSKIAL